MIDTEATNSFNWRTHCCSMPLMFFKSRKWNLGESLSSSKPSNKRFSLRKRFKLKTAFEGYSLGSCVVLLLSSSIEPFELNNVRYMRNRLWFQISSCMRMAGMKLKISAAFDPVEPLNHPKNGWPKAFETDPYSNTCLMTLTHPKSPSLRILSLNCSRHQLLFDSNKNPPNLTAPN